MLIISVMHEHNSHENHSHFSHNLNSGNRKLIVAILLNIVITVSEIFGGIISGSLALLSDAFHNFSDVISLIISYIALKISARNKNENKTFGYKRAEVLAAILNIFILFIAIFFIFKEAIKRFFIPLHINAPIMIIIAFVGLIGNSASILMLFKDAKKNINIKSSFLHLLGDTFSSIAVIIIGFTIVVFPKLYILDPMISMLIVAFIIKEAFTILIESINILMQGIPKGINPGKIIKRLKSDKSLEIIDIHHMHIWEITSDNIVLDCHVVIPDNAFKNVNEMLGKINYILACDYNINHATIQFEAKGYDHSVKCEL
jgi:cobalt-zinc-cadmium efflux system protein